MERDTRIHERRTFRRVLLPFTAGIAAILLVVGGTTAFAAGAAKQAPAGICTLG